LKHGINPEIPTIAYYGNYGNKGCSLLLKFRLFAWRQQKIIVSESFGKVSRSIRLENSSRFSFLVFWIIKSTLFQKIMKNIAIFSLMFCQKLSKSTTIVKNRLNWHSGTFILHESHLGPTWATSGITQVSRRHLKSTSATLSTPWAYLRRFGHISVTLQLLKAHFSHLVTT
jgi:hypothetical protein